LHETCNGSEPVWSGELYLELHRGTLTTQAWIKLANRVAEESLRLAELLGASTSRRTDLDHAWKLTLLNQFHDILPGSSIGWVYDDARKDYDAIADATDAAIDEGLDALGSLVNARGLAEPIAVINPASTARSGVIEIGGELAFAANIPACGVRAVDRAGAPAVERARIEGDGPWLLSNGIIEASVSPQGMIYELARIVGGRRILPANLLNSLWMFDDRPAMWDAWDIDSSYTDSICWMNADDDTIRARVVSKSALRVAVEVRLRISRKSTITQTISLDAGSPRLDVRSRIEWHESHKLLRAEFGTSLVNARCTTGTHFGHVERPTHASTMFEQARFEFPAQGWLDLSEPGAGIALLAPHKFGFSARDGLIGISLLRSPTHPDPRADIGTHEFVYSLMPHEGDWRAAGVHREAEALAAPLRTAEIASKRGSPGDAAWAPFAIHALGPAAATIAAFKHAEDPRDKRLILRLHECNGAAGEIEIEFTLPVTCVEEVSLLERPMSETDVAPTLGRTPIKPGKKRSVRVDLRPFQVITLALEL
jgi:alpha-mannosidase